MPRSALSVVVPGEWDGRSVRFRGGHVIVGFSEKADVDSVVATVSDAIRSELSLSRVEATVHERGRWAVLEFDPPQDASTRIPALSHTLSSIAGVRFAHPNFVGRASGAPDPLRTSQTWIDDLHLEDAWKITTGTDDVLIGVIDSGISMAGLPLALDHEDLMSARFTTGPDFVGGDGDPVDESGHGTHIVGIIAADTDNGVGVAGINKVSPVYIVQAMSASGGIDLNHVASAMEAVRSHAEADAKITRTVINLSLGGFPANALLDDQIEKARMDGNYLIVCAPGSADLYDAIDYPSAYAATNDHVVAVGAIDSSGDIHTPILAARPGDTRDPYRDITLFAFGVGIYSTLLPADGSYGTLSGTSPAAAVVSGVASLMWSVNDKLTPALIKECLVATGVEISDGRFTRRRLDAQAAVDGASWAFELEESPLLILDVPVGGGDSRAAMLNVHSWTSLTFEVSATALDAGLSASVVDASYDPGGGSYAGIVATYTAGAAGAVAFGSFDIRCVEADKTLRVYVSANTAASERTAAVLVADRSGSMAWDSGIIGMSRMDVLKESAKVMVDTVRAGDGFGVVAFDTDAAVVSGVTNITNESPTSAAKTTLKAAIDTLAPASATSIGDGVVLGHSTAAGAAQEKHALVVLTDGHENCDAFIADVMDEVTTPVYAVGMGTLAVIQPASLASLTAATGGYLLLTDTFDDSDRYRVSKYLLQILAGASGASIVRDPNGIVRSGQTISIPFPISRSDHSFDATVMVADDPSVSIELRTPDGTRIRHNALPAGVSYFAGERVRAFRVTPPVLAGDEKHHAGSWEIVVSLPGDKRDSVVADWREFRRPGRLLGVPYAAIVSARSDVRMRCRIDQTGFTPGSVATLRALLTDRGLPSRAKTLVAADVRQPDGTATKFAMQESAPGVFETRLSLAQTGVYTCRFRATGRTHDGDPFVREQTLTPLAWIPTAFDLDRVRAREIDRIRR